MRVAIEVANKEEAQGVAKAMTDPVMASIAVIYGRLAALSEADRKVVLEFIAGRFAGK